MKDTLKTIELLEEHIDRLAESGIYEIERDLLLERLRGLYATALSIEAIAEEELLIGALVGLQEEGVEPAEEHIEEEPAEVPIEEPTEEVAPVEEEPIEEPVEEEFVQEESVEVEPEVEPEHNSNEGLFALYEDEDEPEAEPEVAEPEVEPEPVEEVELELEPEPEVVEEPAEEPAEEPTEEAFEEYFEEEATDRATISLRNTIGVNDKIILMRDLFNGNGEYYDRVITKLDSFDSLDDAMIYIHDNYHWNSKSEGARLLVELLAHKLF